MKVYYILLSFGLHWKNNARQMGIFYTCQTLVFIPFLSCCTVYTILYVIWTTTFLWKHLIKWDKNIDITSSHCIDHGLGFTRQVLSRRYYLFYTFSLLYTKWIQSTVLQFVKWLKVRFCVSFRQVQTRKQVNPDSS